MERFVPRISVAAIAIALLAIAVRAPFFDLPLERDEGEYAYIAWRTSAGETPYLDWFDQKPPAVFVAYRLALAWPGEPHTAIRAVAALFAAASALALFALVRALLGAATGLVAALLYVFASADPRLQGPIANTEIFMAPWIVAAALLTVQFARGRATLARALAAGVSLGIAIAFKQVAAVNAPFLIAVAALAAPRGERARVGLRFALGLLAGGLAVWSLIAAWFWQRGALAPALDAILFHNLEYAADLTFGERLGALRYFVPALVPSQGALWLLAAVGLVAGFARGRDRFAAFFLGGFAAVNAIGVSASGFYFPHYFQQLVPAVAALTAAAITGGSERSPRWRVAAGTGLALAPLVVTAIGFWRLDADEAMRRLYPDNHFETMPAIAAEVAAQTAPDDRVFVFGSEPELLFYARRVSASRYIFLFPVFGSFSDASERQAEVIAEVESAKPAAIVWMPMQSFYGRGRPQALTEWTTAEIDRAYRLRAYAVVDDAGGAEVRRVADGEDPRALIAEHEPWAMVFVRASE